MHRSQRFLTELVQLEDRLAPALTLRFDYTYDDPARGGIGFFSDPARKAALERAGADLTSRIATTPAAITPGSGNTWTASFFNPSSGTQTYVSNLTVGTGEMIVYVGAMAMGSQEAGLGGTGGYQASGSSAFLSNLRTRGQTGFMTWGGSVSFDTTVSWYAGTSSVFDPNLTDLYTVATHELGHVLGFGVSAEFNQRQNGPFFLGSNAVAENGGQAVPLAWDAAHWAQGLTSRGKPVSMQPVLVSGVRYGFTELDYAALKDIGWTITSGTVEQEPRSNTSVQVTTNPVSPLAGAPFTVTATVTRLSGGTPAGTVVFRSGNLTIGSSSLDGSGRATVSAPGYGAGSYTITAEYSGDSQSFGSTGQRAIVIQSPPSPPSPPTPPPAGTSNPDNYISLGGDPFGGSQLLTFNSQGGLSVVAPPAQPFGGFDGTVRSATLDLNADGVIDRVFGIGPGGGSTLRFIDGRTGTDLASTFSIFEDSYTGGIFVAAADFDGDGRDEIVVSPDRGGGARISVLKVQQGTVEVVANFFGIGDPNFRGGARVATADVNGDGQDDLLVAAGFGGGPRIALYDGQFVNGAFSTPRKLVSDFFSFTGADIDFMRNGVFLTGGDFTGDGFDDLVFGAANGSAPRVLIVDGQSLMRDPVQAVSNPLADFYAFDPTQTGGARPLVKQVNGTNQLALIVGSGQGQLAKVNVYRNNNFATPNLSLDVFGGSYLDEGVFVG